MEARPSMAANTAGADEESFRSTHSHGDCSLHSRTKDVPAAIPGNLVHPPFAGKSPPPAEYCR